MTRPFVLDADAFKKIYDEIVTGAKCEDRSIDLIFQSDHILIDERGKIRQQWRDCSCGHDDEFFSSWVSQRLVEDKIREVPVASSKALRSRLDTLGLPQNDRIYIYVATSNAAYCIISEDSDLYDPRAKNWSSDRKRKLRESGHAPVVRYLRKEFDVEIFPLCLLGDHCPEQGICDK